MDETDSLVTTTDEQTQNRIRSGIVNLDSLARSSRSWKFLSIVLFCVAGVALGLAIVSFVRSDTTKREIQEIRLAQDQKASIAYVQSEIDKASHNTEQYVEEHSDSASTRMDSIQATQHKKANMSYVRQEIESVKQFVIDHVNDVITQPSAVIGPPGPAGLAGPPGPSGPAGPTNAPIVIGDLENGVSSNASTNYIAAYDSLAMIHYKISISNLVERDITHGEIGFTSTIASPTPITIAAVSDDEMSNLVPVDVVTELRNANNMDMPTNGSLRYTGTITVACHVAVSMSVTPNSGTGQIAVTYLSVDGELGTKSKMVRKFQNAGDVGNVVFHAFPLIQPNQVMSIVIGNTVATNDFDIVTMNLVAICFPV